VLNADGVGIYTRRRLKYYQSLVVKQGQSNLVLMY